MPIDEKTLCELSDRPTVESVAKLIGQQALENLSEELGGRHLYIPVNPSENTPLSTVIGIDAAKTMAEVWGGLEFVVPVSMGKRQRILRLHAAGMKIIRISAELKISSRHVRRIVNAEKDDNQLSLLTF